MLRTLTNLEVERFFMLLIQLLLVINRLFKCYTIVLNTMRILGGCTYALILSLLLPFIINVSFRCIDAGDNIHL